MEIKIVYNNTAEKNFIASHGFSCIINFNKELLLFDTGWNGLILLENMRKLNINFKKIKYLFLSHFHWDHIGGVPHLLKYIKPLIFVPESFSLNFKNELKKMTEIVEINKSQELLPGIFTTGELKNNGIKEQSMIIESDKNSILITGCAHPGMEIILKAAENIKKITHLIGGLHDFKKFEILRNMKYIAPIHCTKYKDEIKKIFPNKTHLLNAGSIINI